jgi:hypothetical protein
MLLGLAQLVGAQLPVNMGRQVLLYVSLTIHFIVCGLLHSNRHSTPESRPYYSALFGKVG